jgi:hypothetical protein
MRRRKTKKHTKIRSRRRNANTEVSKSGAGIRGVFDVVLSGVELRQRVSAGVRPQVICRNAEVSRLRGGPEKAWDRTMLLAGQKQTSVESESREEVEYWIIPGRAGVNAGYDER